MEFKFKIPEDFLHKYLQTNIDFEIKNKNCLEQINKILENEFVARIRK